MKPLPKRTLFWILVGVGVASLSFMAIQSLRSDPIVGRWGYGTRDAVEIAKDGHIRWARIGFKWRRASPSTIELYSDDPKARRQQVEKVKADISNDGTVLYLGDVRLDKFNGSQEEWTNQELPTE